MGKGEKAGRERKSALEFRNVREKPAIRELVVGFLAVRPAARAKKKGEKYKKEKISAQ